MTSAPNLLELQRQARLYAAKFGLDPFETLFEVLDFDEMNEVAAYLGFPTRFPHWRYGMQYERLSKSYAYGLHKIYEMVINNDPCHAYLLRSNAAVDQKTVIAHVYGHSDFFKNNLWFSQTNRKMVDEMANHGTRIRRYIERHGEERVESFLDTCLSLENLIDVHSVFSPQKRRTRLDFWTEESPETPHKLPSKEYMDRYVNPPDFLDRQKRQIAENLKRKKRFPESPERDVLLFLLEFAPLENWQRDTLAIVREEAYYFAPQAMTKIMNEGWASYWHSKIMTEGFCEPSEIVDFADHHAGTLASAPGQLNPYKVGMELFRDIEDRWNKGKFGPEYDRCDDARLRKQWDKKLGRGREKIFEVRRIYNDVTFIDEFLTKEFCEEQKLFVYRFNPQAGRFEISDRDFEAVKRQLLFSLTNAGNPIIEVEDGNYGNRGELFLRHLHEGADLDLREARDTLRNVQKIWQRPVHLATVVEEEKKVISFDGEKFREEPVRGD
jgi:stage V sporulation protein R